MKAKLFSNNRGAVLVIVALSMIALLAVTGLALDSGIGYGVKAKLNAALDAAAIAAARAVANGDNPQVEGEKFFYANFPDGWMGATPGEPTITAISQANGSWKITAAGSATVPTTFIRILGRDQITVNALAEVTRRDLDLMLVIDSSLSMSGALNDIQEAAKYFVGLFNVETDRIGLVTFSAGAVLNVPIQKAGRGFNKAAIESAIDGLSPSYSTNSEWAMQLAFQDLQDIPSANRSNLRVIVFFSDGAPNTFTAGFTPLSGSQISRALFSEISGNGNGAATNLLNYTTLRGNIPGNPSFDGTRLPELGLGSPAYNLDPVPLGSYNNARTLTTSSGDPDNPYGNTRCNVNKVARNMVENAANLARKEDIVVFTLGYNGSSRLDDYEINFSPGNDCGYGPEEFGRNILERLANTTEALPDGIDNPDQPRGLCIIFDESDEAEAAFAQVASAILRLTR